MFEPKHECAHPDVRTTPWVVCRACGVWKDGVRISDATNESFRELLLTAAPKRRPYSKPTLTTFGDLTKHTRAMGTTGAMDNVRGSMKTG